MAFTPTYIIRSLLNSLYNLSMSEIDQDVVGKITKIKQWLSSGAINIFGIQFSGKDTLGTSLADKLNAKFISSGDIVRSAANNHQDAAIRQAALDSQTGILTPTNEFRQLIIPYLKDPNLAGRPLILSSVGRWLGEEDVIMTALAESEHPLRAVIVLDIPETEIWQRWQAVKHTRNGGRADDLTRERIELRIREFRLKTKPVIEKYRRLGYVIDIDATDTIPNTFRTAILALYKRAIQ